MVKQIKWIRNLFLNVILGKQFGYQGPGAGEKCHSEEFETTEQLNMMSVCVCVLEWESKPLKIDAQH